MNRVPAAVLKRKKRMDGKRERIVEEAAQVFLSPTSRTSAQESRRNFTNRVACANFIHCTNGEREKRRGGATTKRLQKLWVWAWMCGCVGVFHAKGRVRPPAAFLSPLSPLGYWTINLLKGKCAAPELGARLPRACVNHGALLVKIEAYGRVAKKRGGKKYLSVPAIGDISEVWTRVSNGRSGRTTS